MPHRVFYKDCNCENLGIILDKRQIACSSCGRHYLAKGTNGVNIKDNTPEYDAWNAMKSRCSYEKSSPDYKYYAGKGIKVCDEWLSSFNTFLKDMGKRPSPLHSVDRIDSNLGYSASNCRWATKEIQARNTSRNRYLTVNGQTKCLQEWANQLGLTRNAIDNRIKRGKTIEQAVSPERYRTNGKPLPHKVTLTFTLQ